MKHFITDRKPGNRELGRPLIALLAAISLMAACSHEKSTGATSKSGAREGVPVTAGVAVRKSIPVEVRAIGNVQAYSTVAVKAVVGGELKRVHFKEGQDVKQGDLLFTIDPRPFEAALRQAEANLAKNTAQAKQAEANLARDMAQAKNAEVEARRYATLMEQGIVAQEQHDRARTNHEALAAAVRADQAAVETAQAAIRADRAAIDNAKLQLEYCTIRSQIEGRTGSLIIHPGNIVRVNDPTPLVTINQVTPVYVNFTIPEHTLPEIKKYMAAGKLEVRAFPSKESKQGTEGQMTFVDNTVDAGTGTIHLKATFPNRDRALWPGQFVNVLVLLGTQSNVVVVPSQAIQTGQEGQYAFVVKPDLSVESRPVVVGRTTEVETVVEKGLEAGERIVTDGQLRLVPGAKVQIKNANERP